MNTKIKIEKEDQSLHKKDVDFIHNLFKDHEIKILNQYETDEAFFIEVPQSSNQHVEELLIYTSLPWSFD